MGFGIKELVVILVIVLLLFGTKKLKGIGTDLGSAIKGFKKSMADEDDKTAIEQADDATAQKTADAGADKNPSNTAEQKDKSV